MTIRTRAAGLKSDGLGGQHRTEGAIHSVSGNQERYLLAERFTDASYPIPFSYTISGRLDSGALQRAIDDVVARHAILRLDVRNERSGFIAQSRDQAHIPLAHEWALGADEAQVRKRIEQFYATKLAEFGPQDFTRCLLISTAPDAHVLTLSLHHAIGDGVSMDIFAEEVFASYRGDELPPRPPSFYDVIEGGAPSPEAVLAFGQFWRETLSGIEDVATLIADLDFPQAEHGEVVLDLDYNDVRSVAAACDVTPFVVMSAISAIVLARYCGVDDVQLTFQSAGRKPYRGSERVIGPFSNSVVLRTKLKSDEPFADLARRQRTSLTEALENECYPYHLVVRETGVQPRFGINWFPSPFRPQVDGLKISDREFLFYDSNYDVNVRFVRSGSILRMLVHYDASAYSRSRIEQIAAAFGEAVAAVQDDPKRPVARVLAPPAPVTVPSASEAAEERVFDAFLRQAEADPGRVALIGPEGQRLSYGEIEQASARLAKRLIAAGSTTGSRVGILAERGPRLIWTMLGVLRAGATMVPLDGDYPEERLRTLMTIAAIDTLVLPRPAPKPHWAASARHIFFADDEGAQAGTSDEVHLEPLPAPAADEPAYMLFTSGSTGTPKCIATGHRPLLNFLAWQRETFGLTAEDRFTNLCGLAHDMMIRDVFAPLSIGAQLAIPQQDDIFRPGALLEWCIEQQPSVSHLTPAMGKLLGMARSDDQTLPLRLMFFGGDRLQPEIVQKMRELAPAAEIVNFYGTTETPQAAAFHRADPNLRWRTYPIGRGIDHFDLRVVDKDHRPVPDGAPGEIAVLSPFLSLGYVVDGAIQPHPETGAYFTGDTGFVLPSGDVMFTGRTDDQINIRGYRIEIEEINATLRSHPQVREAQVLIDGGDSPRLVAFVAADGLDDDEIYAWLNLKLPHYMVPADIVCVSDMPLLPNGKLDRKALLALPRAERGRADGRSAETALEKELVASWSDILGIDGVSPEQSFAELRGDSLSYVQVFLATEAIVGPLPDDWQIMPISEIAEIKSPRSSWYKWIDSAMLVRALAIVFVVALHLHVFSVGGGATSGLLLVSGFLVGRLQLREAVRSRSSAPFWRLTARVLIPSAIFTTSFYFVKLAVGKPVSLSILLFYADFVDYRDKAAVLAAGGSNYLWYISCFFHMALLLSVVLYVALRVGSRLTARQLAIGLFLVALPLRFVLPGLLDPSIFRTGIPGQSAYGYLPTTNLATFLLGACLATVENPREKLIFALVTVGYAVATYFYSPSNSFAMLTVFGLMMLYVPRLPILRGMHMVILFLSGASLFIYLTHQQAAHIFEWLGVLEGSVLLTILVLLFGIGLWLVWQRVSPLNGGWRRTFRSVRKEDPFTELAPT